MLSYIIFYAKNMEMYGFILLTERFLLWSEVLDNVFQKALLLKYDHPGTLFLVLLKTVNNPKLTPEENEFMRSEFQKEYDRNNWSMDEYTHEPGKTYYGGIAEAFGAGGGTQLELPMAISSLKELGMIHEI